ncbi:MAG: glycogen synthase GlgA [Candidatus Hydrogenedentes bacterium]|nr:glycogen synthase GlgA [Candidatus Hydrogenedentota bacterium]
MKILYLTSELSPLVSSGGLGEVAFSLPKALRKAGIDIRVALPKYKTMKALESCKLLYSNRINSFHYNLWETRIPESEVTLYLIENDFFFGREHIYGYGDWEYEDNPARFSFFCNAILEAVEKLGWIPDIIHCNDWQTAPALGFLYTRLENSPTWTYTSSLLTIHNLAFQGRYPSSRFNLTGLPCELLQPNCFEYYGDMNLLKGGILLADKINTVSPTYALEIQTLEYGFGLDGILRTRSEDIHGILNGVDYNIWSPVKDPHILLNYSYQELDKKSECKVDLQRKLNLQTSDVPLFGIVSRLYWQKGIDILISAFPEILRMELQFIILGTGDPKYEKVLTEMQGIFTHNLRVVIGFDRSLAHKILAGCDFIVMPSRYEPCGLTQMYAMAYGTIPVVRRTGGLADTVKDLTPVNLRKKEATGISFRPLTPKTIIRSVLESCEVFKNKNLMKEVRINGMARNFSWDNQSKHYISLYEEIISQR